MKLNCKFNNENNFFAINDFNKIEESEDSFSFLPTLNPSKTNNEKSKKKEELK